MNLALSRSRAALLVVDIQDRLFGAMPGAVGAALVRNTQILVETAARLGMPIVVSQQYPKGLGPTVQPLEDALASAPAGSVHRFDKTVFSAAQAPELDALTTTLHRDQWIVVGMETHVCVYQTARDLASRGHQVHVVADAVASRTKANWRMGMDLAVRVGAIPTSTEVVVFDLLGRAGTDEFKALSKLIR